MACSPSPHGTATGGCSSWLGIGWGRSRSTGCTRAPTGSRSPASCGRCACCPGSTCRSTRPRRRHCSTGRSCRIRARSTPGCASCRPVDCSRCRSPTTPSRWRNGRGGRSATRSTRAIDDRSTLDARRGSGGTGEPARGRGGDADGERRAARRVPVGRDRFLADLGAGATGSAGANPADVHRLDARTRIRRVAPCCDRRPASRNRSPGGRPLARRCVRPHPTAAGHLGRTVRRPVDAPDRVALSGCSPTADRLPRRRRRRRTVCRLQPPRLRRVDLPPGGSPARPACGRAIAAGLLAPSPAHDRQGIARGLPGAARHLAGSRTPATRCRRLPRSSGPTAGRGTRSPRSGRRPTSAPRPPGRRCRISSGRIDEVEQLMLADTVGGAARPDAREAGPGEHGGVARSAGAVPRPPAPRMGVASTHVDQDLRRGRQGRAPACRRAGAAR